jgi:hypothetical protein
VRIVLGEQRENQVTEVADVSTPAITKSQLIRIVAAKKS